MGTRAAFWAGNPQELETRTWLGCIAFDGYPDNPLFNKLPLIQSPNDFSDWVAEFLSEMSDFSSPTKGWPFPWAYDIFLTDFTYAFFDNRVNVTSFHHGWKAFSPDMEFDEERDDLPENVPAPKGYDRTQPDSIIVISRKE